MKPSVRGGGRQWLLHAITRAIAGGEFEQALALADRVVALGEAQGDPDTVDRGLCNRASVLMGLGRGAEATRSLQAVLMRSQHDETRHLAAYNLSLIYAERDTFEKGQSYARHALHSGRLSGNLRFVANALNQCASLSAAGSYFDKAIDCLEEAISLNNNAPSVERAIMQLNLGSAYLMTERPHDGLCVLLQSLDVLRQQPRPYWIHASTAHLAISYGYLEEHRLDRARRHGRAGQRVARIIDDRERTEMSLYLLGEIEKQAGRPNRAYQIFDELHRDHFPTCDGLSDILMSVNAHKIVNLLS